MKEEYQKKMHDGRSKGFKEKSLLGKFRKSAQAVADERPWKWLKMRYMKKRTEAIIIASQGQTLRTNWIKHMIDKQDISPKCRICQTEHESAMYIARGCEVLAKNVTSISQKRYQLQLIAVLRYYGMWKSMERSDTADRS